MSVWPVVAFNDLVSDETGGNIKTLQSEYLPSGEFPIIDQGQNLIGGYTNDPSRVCKSELPVIIFGDHTKCFKFVDFPFCLGADGTKILRPRRPVDERYLFYALQRVHIPDAGYSRHFKYLKEACIPLPSIDEQKRIAAILDQADGLRRKRQRAIHRLNQLGQAIFQETFGDPKLEPNRWDRLSFSDACSDQTSKSEKLPRGEYLMDGAYPVVDQGQSRIAGWCNDSRMLCQSKLPVIVFGDHTRAIKYIDFPFVIGADGAKVILPSERYNPIFFSELMRQLPIPDLGYSRHMREVKRLTFPCPPLSLQRAFAERISGAERFRESLEKSMAKVAALFNALQHRAFQGEM